MRREYSDQGKWERASLRVAHHIRSLWEEKGSSDTRLLESFFLPDVFTVVGRSLSEPGFGRREHVIPKRVIIEECHLMLHKEATDSQIAAFIRNHVRIVHITREESERLDRKSELNMRQTMPPGWKFGDDPYARLKAAGIKWRPVHRKVI